MTSRISRRTFVGTAAGLAAAGAFGISTQGTFAQDKVKLRLSSPATPTDQRAVCLTEIFAPAVAGFAEFEPHWNATLFKQGTELEAIARGNLEMSIASAQELGDDLSGMVDLRRRLSAPRCRTPEEGLRRRLHERR